MRRSGLKLAACFLVLAGLALAGGCGDGKTKGAGVPRVLVVGIDGMDPSVLHRLMRDKKMPNFSRLARTGSFLPLGTSIPPQSPVAWSNFITGMNPGGHGIFDFLRHDHRTFAVAESTTFLQKPSRVLGIPVGGGMVNLRKGKAFWEYLEERGVPATVFRVPANFPPVGRTTRTFSGMGTPDMRGTKGWFTFYTDDPPDDADSYTGGSVVAIEARDHVIRTELTGPPNPFDEKEEPVRVPLTVYVGAGGKVARLDVGDARILLQPGEWSDWVRVEFPMFGPVASATGIVRFFLKSLRPGFRLYASPVNVDPADPAFPISTPDGEVRAQSAALGAFYTQGMPADTKALEWNVLNEDEFLIQVLSVLRERERLFDYELERFRDGGGFLFYYFSSVDLANHMMWSAADSVHPGYRNGLSARVKSAMSMLYVEMYRIFGRILDTLDEGTTLIVMSDHGFAPYYRQVHLNNWLAREGFLALFNPEKKAGAGIRDDVDWLQTRAYAIGFNGIFLNLQGREDLGRVTVKRKEEVLREIERKLLKWRDPANGQTVVSRIYRPEKVYSGPYVAAAPDLLIGYARGYRGSDATALGEFGSIEIEDNHDKWSGDHMIAAEEVPGILLVNRNVSNRRPSLVDLPVTILELYGIPKPEQMIGRSLFKKD